MNQCQIFIICCYKLKNITLRLVLTGWTFIQHAIVGSFKNEFWHIYDDISCIKIRQLFAIIQPSY